MEGRIEFALTVWRKAKPFIAAAAGGAVVGFVLCALVWA